MRLLKCKTEAFWVVGPNETSTRGVPEWTYRVYLTETFDETTDESFEATFRRLDEDRMIAMVLMAPNNEFAHRGIATALLGLAQSDLQKRIVSPSKSRPRFSDEKLSADAEVVIEAMFGKGQLRYDAIDDRYEFLPSE